MSTQNALEKFTSATNALKDFQDRHEEIFAEARRLGMLIVDAENELRDEVAEAKEGVSNGSYKVMYVPQTQTWADIEEIDALIAGGKVAEEYRARIVKTQERPGRITIVAQ